MIIMGFWEDYEFYKNEKIQKQREEQRKELLGWLFWFWLWE